MITRHRAFTLVELVIAIALIAVLLGFLLVGITKIRLASIELAEKNRLRQLLLATHQYSNLRDGRLPSVSGGPKSTEPLVPIMLSIVDVIDPVFTASDQFGDPLHRNPYFQSQLDVSQSEMHAGGDVNYTFNAMVFHDYGRLSNVTDGLSHTIAMSENYQYCGRATTFKSISRFGSQGRDKEILQGSAMFHLRPAFRPSFADSIRGDVYPITDANGSLSIIVQYPYHPIFQDHFQVRPLQMNCNPFVPVANSSSGLLVGLLDGSVRTLKPTTNKITFWSMVTPSGNEVIVE